MSIFSIFGKKYDQMWDLYKLWRKVTAAFKEGKKMAMLPDKAAVNSATIWGGFFKAAAAILIAVGAASAGEAGWDGVIHAVTTQAGAIIAVVGYLLGMVGKRKIDGELVAAAKKAAK